MMLKDAKISRSKFRPIRRWCAVRPQRPFHFSLVQICRFVPYAPEEFLYVLSVDWDAVTMLQCSRPCSSRLQSSSADCQQRCQRDSSSPDPAAVDVSSSLLTAFISEWNYMSFCVQWVTENCWKILMSENSRLLCKVWSWSFGGNSAAKLEFWAAAVIFYDGNLHLSVGKLQLFALACFFNPRRCTHRPTCTMFDHCFCLITENLQKWTTSHRQYPSRLLSYTAPDVG